MGHQWFNHNFAKLREYFLCAKKTKITLFKNSSPHPNERRHCAEYHNAWGEELLNKVVIFVFFAHKKYFFILSRCRSRVCYPIMPRTHKHCGKRSWRAAHDWDSASLSWRKRKENWPIRCQKDTIMSIQNVSHWITPDIFIKYGMNVCSFSLKFIYYSTIQSFGVNNLFLFFCFFLWNKEINTFIQQGFIKLIKKCQ